MPLLTLQDKSLRSAVEIRKIENADNKKRPSSFGECFSFDEGPFFKVPRNWLMRFGYLFLDQRYSSTVLMRLTQFFFDMSKPCWSRFVSRLNGIMNGIEVSPRSNIGSGVLFHHRRVVFGGETELGRGVHLYANVNFGLRNGGHPQVGDHVQIFANCVITGPIKIGKYAVIAPNSVVRNDVPEFAVVSGNPATVLKFRKMPKDPWVQYGERGSGAG